jgi:uncharacterized protein
MNVTPPAGLYKGIEEFNAGKFFECHETLELIWNEEPGEVRKLYQGILQIGVGFYHATVRKNYRGTVSLLEGGIEKCRPFAPHYFGIDLESLIIAAQKALEHARSLGAEHIADFDRLYIPKINYRREERGKRKEE